MQRVFERVRADGLRTTGSYASQLILKKISPNYGLNPARVRALPRFSFFGFIVRDGMRALIDRLCTIIGNRFTRRSQLDAAHLAPFSLYFLDPQKISGDSIVYSFGVGKNIDFDRAVSSQYGCHVFLFDPTPPALRFMQTCDLGQHMTFMPVGLWTETKKMKFYLDRNSAGSGNLSITNLFQTDDFVEADSMTLPDIMRQLGHDHVDILKVDIEGAGMPVLQALLRSNIRPTQMVAELEPPKRIYGATLREIIAFFKSKKALFDALEDNGYRIRTYGKAEFVAVRY